MVNDNDNNMPRKSSTSSTTRRARNRSTSRHQSGRTNHSRQTTAAGASGRGRIVLTTQPRTEPDLRRLARALIELARLELDQEEQGNADEARVDNQTDSHIDPTSTSDVDPNTNSDGGEAS